jgi:hypothetical protein
MHWLEPVLWIWNGTYPLAFWSAGSGSALGKRIRIEEGQKEPKSEENSSFEVLDATFEG